MEAATADHRALRDRRDCDGPDQRVSYRRRPGLCRKDEPRILGKRLTPAILVSVGASLAGDIVWYELGRHRGRHALSLLCRISLEPDSCVQRTENFFTRHGIRALILAKFIPGLSTLAPALAGLFGIRLKRFLLYNGLGAVLWTLAFLLPGYVFSSQLEAMAAQEARVGSFLLVALGIGLGAYIAYKFAHRQWLLRALHTARITPTSSNA